MKKEFCLCFGSTLIRPTTDRLMKINSSQQLFRFTVNEMPSNLIKILSMSEDKLLISSGLISFVFNHQGVCLSNLSYNEQIQDATWTPSGYILCATTKTKEVVVLSRNSSIIKSTRMPYPFAFSVSHDIIYLADYDTGIYQSHDDGLTWSFLFNITSGWRSKQVIKVYIDHVGEFWTLEEFTASTRKIYRLSVYSLNRTSSDCIMAWREIKFPSTVHIDLEDSKLIYDGNTSILLRDYHRQAVHVFLVNGQYQCCLLPPATFKNNKPFSLAVDKEHNLYVGQLNGIVQVFKLIYE